jgi:hypothetical protein
MTIRENIRTRGKGRKRVLMSATVISRKGSHKVLIRDVSTHGTQMYTGIPLAKGDDVCFVHGELFVAARVSWCRKGIAGLQFYRELTASELEAAFNSALAVRPSSSQGCTDDANAGTDSDNGKSDAGHVSSDEGVPERLGRCEG